MMPRRIGLRPCRAIRKALHEQVFICYQQIVGLDNDDMPMTKSQPRSQALGQITARCRLTAISHGSA
jgi:hypothetical protein